MITHAGDRSERPVDHSNDVGDCDLGRGSSQAEPTVGAAFRHDDSAERKLSKQLLEISHRQLESSGNVRAVRPLFAVLGNHEQRETRIFARDSQFHEAMLTMLT